MRVRWTATALAEIDQILSYIAADNPSAAATVASEVQQTLKRITSYPPLAPVVYKGTVRAISVGRYHYRVFYEVYGNDLIIRNVRSTRRQRPWED